MTGKKITIVTPNYNCVDYIEETINSVLSQNYENLEYIIIDGGTTDGSVEIIKKYEKHLAYWVSEPDNGQADAINKGFSLATGDIFAWVNSDDYYLPGSLKFISTFLNTKIPQIAYGNAFHFIENKPKAWGSDVIKNFNEFDQRKIYTIIQPSTFWTRKAWEINGVLDESLHYAFDWEWFTRAISKGIKFVGTHKYLAVYRFHEINKTLIGKNKRRDEIIEVYKKLLGQDFALYAQSISRNKQKLWSFRNKLRKYRLKKLEDKIMTLRYYKLLKKFDYESFLCVMDMV